MDDEVKEILKERGIETTIETKDLKIVCEDDEKMQIEVVGDLVILKD